MFLYMVADNHCIIYAWFSEILSYPLFFWFTASEFLVLRVVFNSRATSDVRREIVLTNTCQMTDQQSGYRGADDICCIEAPNA